MQQNSSRPNGAPKMVVSVQEFAKIMGISRGSAYETVRRGEVRSIRLGKRLVIPAAAVQALLDGDQASARPA